MAQYRLPVRCLKLGCRRSAGGALLGGGPSLSGVIRRNARWWRRELTPLGLVGGDRPYSIATPNWNSAQLLKRKYQSTLEEPFRGGQSTVPGGCSNSSMCLGKALVSVSGHSTRQELRPIRHVAYLNDSRSGIRPGSEPNCIRSVMKIAT